MRSYVVEVTDNTEFRFPIKAKLMNCITMIIVI